MQNAQRISQRFALTEAEAPGVIRICQLTEGVPLGIELAATWVRSRSCAAIAGEIESNLDVLSSHLRNVPARHRSIRATFEHSWQLLTAKEQRTLAGLSIFRGGSCREAAVRVAETSLNTLTALLDKSLVSQVAPDRYSLHALLGQYAAEKLQADPKACARIQAQHIHYFAGFLERQATHLRGPQQKQILAEIASEIENARQAWQWAVAGDYWHEVDQSLDSLYYFFDVQGRFQEGIDLFAQVPDHCHDPQEHEAICGRILSRQGIHLNNLGTLLHVLEEYEAAQSLYQESLEICCQIGDRIGQAIALSNLGRVTHERGAYSQAIAFHREGLAIGLAHRHPACERAVQERAACFLDEHARQIRDLAAEYAVGLVDSYQAFTNHVERGGYAGELMSTDTHTTTIILYKHRKGLTCYGWRKSGFRRYGCCNGG